MNDSNLIPMNKRTKEEQRAIATAGGKASGKSRQEKRKLKDCMDALLSLDVMNEEQKKMLSDLGITEKTSNKMLLVVALFNKAVTTGEVSAFKEIRNLIGEDDNNTEDMIAKLDEVLNEIGGNI